MKFETKSIYSVDAFDLDELVYDTYGVTRNVYSFASTEESANDTSHEFSVDGQLDEWTERELQEWEDSEGKTWIQNHAILDDLCRRGLIPAGDWVVRVSW